MIEDAAGLRSRSSREIPPRVSTAPPRLRTIVGRAVMSRRTLSPARARVGARREVDQGVEAEVLNLPRSRSLRRGWVTPSRRRRRDSLPPPPQLAPYSAPCPPPESRPARRTRKRRGPTCSRSTSISRRCSIPPWSSRSRRVRRSAAAEIREPGAGKPSARPDRRDGERRIAEGAARARRPQHPRAPALDAASAAAAGQVRGRAAVPRRVRIRAEGRPAAGDRGAGRRAFGDTSATRCCSASPARARPSPWPR